MKDLDQVRIIGVKKIELLTMSKINCLYFTINVFNYFYTAHGNVSLEDAETLKSKKMLQFLVRYDLNVSISTMSFCVHTEPLPLDTRTVLLHPFTLIT